ncbi:terminase large subunit domain-containing protein [Amycolatopsis sp. DSM 110486]|uniref:terminase large subunit domain-containing protein n=1 Tax=Amycolatopsis sp. DSM 110486 TaxID=2865832 RepID=UPI001C6A23BA|nr:terminase family protein [Amycolatopsis sp. DSM 110486]QYN17595.1 terminase family protein [Amycolatopsis sp. DSM 110486]
MTAVAYYSPEDEAAIAEEHERLAERSLVEPAGVAEFCDQRFVRRPHTNLISREMARIGWGEFNRLIVMVPPQTGKTTLAAVWGSFWWLARNPAHRLIIGSYGSNLATSRGKQVRKLVHIHGWRYNLAVEWGSGTVNDWQLETGGGVRSVGVGSGVTGNPADCLVIDDPHKSRAEAESSTVREGVWDWYSSDLQSRLAPGAPVILIMTPWHHDDLAHRVMKQDGTTDEGGAWRVVKLPAFAGGGDPLGREPGEPLSHPKIAEDDTEALRAFWEGRRRSISARDWVSLYLCDPKPTTTALVSETLLQERTHRPPPAAPRKSAVAIDPSGGGRDVAGVVGGFLGDDDRVYITHDVSLVGPSAQWGKAAAYLAAEIDAEFIVFESNFGGDQGEVVIKTSWETAQRTHPNDERFQRLMPQIKSVRAKKGKLLRAEPIAQQFVDDRLRLGAHLPELFDEWHTWRPTDIESPGRIDASVYLAYELLAMRNQPSVVSPHPAMANAADPALALANRFSRPGGPFPLGGNRPSRPLG